MSDFPCDAERSNSAKVAMRDQLLTRRKSLSDAVRRSASASVQATTMALVRRERPTLCAAYVPIGPEPGGPTLPARLAEALPPGGRLILPVLLASNELDWAVYDGDLRPSARGLREPIGDRCGVDVVAEASLIIVPAVAVSRFGMRLGRGGGSYDRVLARARAAYKVALLHDGELLDDVPSEPHDRPVDAVVTPTGGLSATPAGRNKLR